MTASRHRKRISPGDAAKAQTEAILQELPAVLAEIGIDPETVDVEVELPNQDTFE